MSKIQIPHKFTPRPYQLPFLKAMDSGKKRAVKVWHRRSGKDKTDWNFLIKKACTEVGNYYYFFPTAILARKAIWENIDNSGFRTLDHIPKDLIVSSQSQSMTVELVNGSTISLMGSDKFEERAVGTNPKGVVFSEYSITEPQVWNFIRPILRVNKGWAVFNFTPRGTNHAYALLQLAQQDPETWFSEVLTIEDTGVLGLEDIEQERKEGMPEDLVQQEYYCKFIESAGQFFKRIDHNIINVYEPDPTHEYQVGIDLAKYQDFTAIAPFDLNTFSFARIERFNQIDWNLQKARIENTYLKLNSPVMYMDSTGLGDPIYDDLVNRGIQNVVSFKFTQKSRMDLLNNFKVLIEQDRIKLPNDPILLNEMKSMQYDITDSGRLTVKVPDGLHDDMIMAAALAVWQIPQSPRAPRGVGLRKLTRGSIGGGPELVISNYE